MLKVGASSRCDAHASTAMKALRGAKPVLSYRYTRCTSYVRAWGCEGADLHGGDLRAQLGQRSCVRLTISLPRLLLRHQVRHQRLKI